MLYPEEEIVLRAEYSENEVTIIDEIEITIHIGCTVSELVVRNLEDTLKFKQQVLLSLEQAMARERATTSVIKEFRPSGGNGSNRPDLNKAVNQVLLATVREELVKTNINESVDNLIGVLEIFADDSPYIEDTKAFGKMLSLTYSEEIQNADVNGDGTVNMLDIAVINKFWFEKY